MANEPKSPITALAERLAQQPSLKSRGVSVFAWRKAQAKSTSSGRIVIFPTKSGLPAATSQTDALCDVQQQMAAECWGGNGDQTWALMTWLIQALESQSIGTDLDENVADSGPGYGWSLLGADWETTADTSSQGEVVTVLFQIQLAIPAVAGDLGHMGNWPLGRIEKASQDFPDTREVTDA